MITSVCAHWSHPSTTHLPATPRSMIGRNVSRAYSIGGGAGVEADVVGINADGTPPRRSAKSAMIGIALKDRKPRAVTVTDTILSVQRREPT